MQKLLLDGKSLNIEILGEVVQDRISIDIDDDSWAKVRAAREIIEDALKDGKTIYGANTGTGSYKKHKLDSKNIVEFNSRLVKAHATIIPAKKFEQDHLKTSLLILINGLVRGESGVSEGVIKALIEAFDSDIELEAYSNNSISAGDIIPINQLVSCILDSKEIELELKAKDAMSLMCSNAIALGRAALLINESNRLLKAFDLVLAVSLEGFRGNLNTILAANDYNKDSLSAKNLIEFLDKSELWNEGEARLIQDPLSFRCAVRINNASYRTLDWAKEILEEEINSSQDNPRVLIDDKCILANGNIDSTMLTLVLDSFRQALAHMSKVSSERTHKQQWAEFSGLNIGLADGEQADAGVQFLNLGHLAESQMSYVQFLSSPTLSSYSGQVADGVEDTAGVAALSAEFLDNMIGHMWNIISLELIVSSWAINARKLDPDRLGKGVADIYNKVLPLLPIGKEGEEIFNIEQIVELLKEQVKG